MSDQTDPPVLAPAEPSFAERWVADFRLLAVLCARTYGSIAIVALIALNAVAWLVTREPYFVGGAAAGVAAAFAAYINFTAIAQDADEALISTSMWASIACGAIAGVVFLSAAL